MDVAERVLDEQLQRLQNDLNGKIQLLSNWIDILDSTAVETIYGILLVDRGKDPRQLWRQLQEEVAGIRKLSAQIKSAGGDLSRAR